MTPERYRQVRAVFDNAVRCERHRRESLLAEACMGDPDLRVAVERLLAADAESSREDFLDVPTAVRNPPWQTSGPATTQRLNRSSARSWPILW